VRSCVEAHGDQSAHEAIGEGPVRTREVVDHIAYEVNIIDVKDAQLFETHALLCGLGESAIKVASALCPSCRDPDFAAGRFLPCLDIAIYYC